MKLITNHQPTINGLVNAFKQVQNEGGVVA